jgi:hypothetical protein
MLPVRNERPWQEAKWYDVTKRKETRMFDQREMRS